MNKPFARATSMLRMIAAALAAGAGVSALPSIVGNYTSRGHGLGRVSGKKWSWSRSQYIPHQGKRECERRMRQIKRGIISVSA